jgi:hypothetical protein
VQADFIVETSPANRKTQSFADSDENRYFYPDWDISAFKRSIRSILRSERSARRFQRRNKSSNSQNPIYPRFHPKLLFRSWLRYFGVFSLFPLHSTIRTQCRPVSASKQALQLAKLNLSSITSKTVISLVIEIFRCFLALSTPFYAPNAVQTDFCVETGPATRKTQSFLDYIQNCYFVSDWDISVFFRSFHSILRSERVACRFHCWNKPSNSQNAILRRFRRKLLFRSWLRYFGV